MRVGTKNLKTGLWRMRIVGVSGSPRPKAPMHPEVTDRGSEHRKAVAAYHKKKRSEGPKKAKSWRKYLSRWGKN